MIRDYKSLLVPTNARKQSYLGEETSLFTEALSYISESDDMIREFVFGSNNLVTEGFKDRIKFTEIIKFIFNSFIKLIDKIYNQFKAIIVKMIAGDGTIKKYEDRLRNYGNTISYYNQYYNYTNLEADIPPSSLNLFFSEEYEVLYEKLQKIGEKSKKEEILSGLASIYDEVLKQNENYYFNVRSKCLSQVKKKFIPEENYADALFRLFRDDVSEPLDENKVPASMVRKAATRFFDNKEILSTTEKTKKQIQKSGDRVAKDITRINPKDFIKGYTPIDYEIEANLDKILKYKSAQLSKACNIIVMAYSAKLEAIKSCNIQDRKMLIQAITELVAAGGDK